MTAMQRDTLRKKLFETFGHLTDAQLMGACVWAEARGEVREGKIAVASVVMERVEHRAWDGTTVKGVILCPHQFSAFLPLDRNYRRLAEFAADFETAMIASPPLANCVAIAEGILAGDIPRDPVIAANHCTQYVEISHRRRLDEAVTKRGDTMELARIDRSRWWKNMRLVATIGRHEFYAETPCTCR
jgi:hypothetical protein